MECVKSVKASDMKRPRLPSVRMERMGRVLAGVWNRSGGLSPSSWQFVGGFVEVCDAESGMDA